MSLNEIQQGIAAMQAGDLQRGDALLRQGLQDPNLTPDVRAVALMWLAETSPNPQFKIQCYQAALDAAPTDENLRQRLKALIAAAQTPSPPPMTPPPPSQGMSPLAPHHEAGYDKPDLKPPPNLPESRGNQPTDPIDPRTDVPHIWEFGVRGEPNGTGSGFMVVRNGLIATARFVVGSAANVVLVTRDGRELDGQVVRSYPQYDLAFIRVRLSVPFLRDITPTNNVKPGTVLVADDYTERRVRAECRHTRQDVPEGWFPTTFTDDLPRTFTGAPIINEQNDLVGMLTRNATRSAGQLYGLHISLIRRKIEAYHAEMEEDPNRMYCGTCGSLSKAGTEGFFYCETCGAVLPYARRIRRTPHPKAYIYYDKES